jgi:hypothetical protein
MPSIFAYFDFQKKKNTYVTVYVCHLALCRLTPHWVLQRRT